MVASPLLYRFTESLQRKRDDDGVAKKNILVVDDEPWSLKFISRFLRKEGYEVTEASDGAEAIDLIDNSRFDLVLSDVRMPRLDGVALAMHIRSRIPTIPIILMTGVPLDLTPTLGYNLPCLSKPLSLDELRSNIQRVLF
jgi:CheY-like chemotaxis protein